MKKQRLNFYTIVVFLFLSTALSSPLSMATRLWNRHLIPGTKCGNGQTFAAFIDYKNPKKIAIKLHGGNACWDAFTCHGPFDIVKLGPIKNLEDNSGFTSADPNISPLSDYTIINIPYCTADVHLGKHKARYKGKLMHHYGMINVINTIAYFFQDDRLHWENVQELTLMGTSAGALGALFHISTLDPYVKHIPKKSLILDAPGLHWGDDFWYKFSWSLLKDYKNALEQIGYNFDIDSGNVANLVNLACKSFPDWNIGAVLSSRDLVMSVVFGNISQSDHHKLVIGRRGLYGFTHENPNDNCSAWVAVDSKHQYLVENTDMRKKVENFSLYNYVQSVISHQKTASYIGELKE